MRWGVCATVAAPPEQVEAFVAHHLELGATRIWLFLDDPEAPEAGSLADLPEVTVTRCTLGWWRRTLGYRPARHQNRQTHNIKHVYAKSRVSWLAHLDVDEFLLSEEPVSPLLAAVPADQPLVRAAPWEALSDAALPDDVFTARHFRRAVPGKECAAERDIAFGPHAALLPEGALSHSAGKCFFRTGLARFEPRLHGAFRAGERVRDVPFHPALTLLHFHAEDRTRWLERLPFRLRLGAYQFNKNLQDYLLAAGPAEVAAFYDRVQDPDPATRAALDARGLLREVRLGLRAKMAKLEARRQRA
ncbi:glycosyltransferase family 2 protein [Rhodobacter sp. NSM]|uniref:glycosyltransferase family 2 protein n=1 Tax=Rhodobacter sp. NSM TaxID=3457501 RepID=UPI003FD40788